MILLNQPNESGLTTAEMVKSAPMSEVGTLPDAILALLQLQSAEPLPTFHCAHDTFVGVQSFALPLESVAHPSIL